MLDVDSNVSAIAYDKPYQRGELALFYLLLGYRYSLCHAETVTSQFWHHHHHHRLGAPFSPAPSFLLDYKSISSLCVEEQASWCASDLHQLVLICFCVVLLIAHLLLLTVRAHNSLEQSGGWLVAIAVS